MNKTERQIQNQSTGRRCWLTCACIFLLITAASLLWRISVELCNTSEKEDFFAPSLGLIFCAIWAICFFVNICFCKNAPHHKTAFGTFLANAFSFLSVITLLTTAYFLRFLPTIYASKMEEGGFFYSCYFIFSNLGHQFEENPGALLFFCVLFGIFNMLYTTLLLRKQSSHPLFMSITASILATSTLAFSYVICTILYSPVL